MSRWNFYNNNNNCNENNNRSNCQKDCDCGCQKNPCADECCCEYNCLECPPGPQGPIGPIGSTNIARTGPDSFNLAQIGTYQVLFEVSVDEAGQLILTLNGEDLAYAVVAEPQALHKLLVCLL